jgi:hypothetical protein
MKLTFIIHNAYHTDKVMQLLKDNGIDYYTRWDHATGKGHGTEPHLGQGSYGSTNAVLMVAFEDEAPMQALISAIRSSQPPRSSNIRRPAMVRAECHFGRFPWQHPGRVS